MDGLCKISEKKYKYMRRAAIIMPIVAVVLVMAFVWLMSALYKSFTAEYVPIDGVWYCEKMGLEVDFDGGSPNIMTTTNGTQYLVYSHKKRTVVRVYTIAKTVPEVVNGKVEYLHYPGELAYDFFYVSLEEDQYIVQDENGNQYVFVRK